MKCKTCRHYGFYQMITNGPYGYAGTIPCTGCVHFSFDTDHYEPIVDKTGNQYGIGKIENHLDKFTKI